MPATPTRAVQAPPAARCWTLQGPEGAVDVEVIAPDEAVLAEVLPQLSRALGVTVRRLWSPSARLPAELPLGAAELAHGAVLGIDGAPHGVVAQRRSALELLVVGGPDSGQALPLVQGRHVLGRGTAAGIRLADPDVSRRHLVLSVAGAEICVADLGSRNGSRLDDAVLDTRPRPWRVGQSVGLGSTTLRLAGPAGHPAVTEPAAGGRTRVRPTPLIQPPPPALEIRLPAPPDEPPRRKLGWIAVALPAVAGLAMAWLMQAPSFLFFTLLSPLMALGTWLSERWSGRRSGRCAALAHAAAEREARTRLTAAVRADARAGESAQPDLATLVTAVRQRSSLLWSRRSAGPDGLTVRVGTGPGATRVTVIRPDGTRNAEPAARLPLLVDLAGGGGLGIVGPGGASIGILTGVLVRLAALHPPGDLEFVLAVDAERLPEWGWARWLPHLDPASVQVRSPGPGRGGSGDDPQRSWWSDLIARRRAAVAAGRGLSRLVVVCDGALDPRTASMISGARDAGLLVLARAATAAELPVPLETVLRLTGETGGTAVLSRNGHPDRAVTSLDAVRPAVAAAFARDMAPLLPAIADEALPRDVRLLELPGAALGLDGSGAAAGSWTRERGALRATIGRSAAGPVELDLCRDGPHALVAGTTGSGKSELLQSLVSGLALNHPPDRCSFLLVDYKGGAAFADAVDLPHTVGLVTDLDQQSTARALRSLAAELTRREAVLAAHGATDVNALPDDVALARLVIVVDEFATLAEELPQFVPGLVGIAQRGRSLGVHLVLATQRPGGVVSPEIRANCSLRICLRTTDEADSRDVLGTSDAAHLPADLPGRAYLRTGGGHPTPLQVGRVAVPAAPADTRPAVTRWDWPWSAAAQSVPPQGDTDLARLVAALAGRARTDGIVLPHRPWRPPLPARLTVEDLVEVSTPAAPSGGHVGAGGRIAIGVLDRPDEQRQERLELDLSAGGGWLFVGGPRSGRTTALRTVLGEAVRALGADGLHVHVIDTAGPLATDAAGLPHTGTAIGGESPLRTVRLIDRLAQEIGERRARGGAGEEPRILLLVDGVESVCALLDEYDPARGSGALLGLVRDGAAVGLTSLLTADRAVPGGRLAAVATRRLLLPLPDRADYAVAGIPGAAVPGVRVPGRGLLGEQALECQLSLPRPLPGPPAHTAPAGAHARPLRIPELPADPVVEITAGRALLLTVGPGGDEGGVLVADLRRHGGLLVAGPPGSGRTAALDAFARQLAADGSPVLRLGRHETEPPLDEPGSCHWVERDDAEGVGRWLAGLAGRPGVVIADDVGAPAEDAALAALPAPGASTGVILLAASSAGQLSAHYQGPIAALRRSRAGLLLCAGPGDADLLGTRLPRTPTPVRPGSGWLVTGGPPQRVQVARRRASPLVRENPQSAAAPHRSSSSAPISCVAYQASS